MRLAWQATRLLALPTIAFVVALALAPTRARLEVHVWLLVVLSLGVIAIIVAAQAAFPRTPSAFSASLRPVPVAAELPAPLIRLERTASMASSAAFDVHFRLRPPLRELAAELLSARRGIDLDREPDRSRAVLGDEAWDLVRPDRPPPTDRHGAGIDEATLDRVVTALEHV